MEKNILFGRALARIRVKIENNTLFGRALVRARAKIEKNTLFGNGLVKIWAKIEITPFQARLWLGFGQKKRKHP